MICLICGCNACYGPRSTDFREVLCPKCGEFSLPEALARDIERGSVSLDIDRVRAFLADRLRLKQGLWITRIDIANYQLAGAATNGSGGCFPFG